MSILGVTVCFNKDGHNIKIVKKVSLPKRLKASHLILAGNADPQERKGILPSINNLKMVMFWRFRFSVTKDI